MSSKNIVDLRNKRPTPAPRDTVPLPLRAPEPPRRREPLRARRRRARLVTLVLVVILLGLLTAAVSVASYLPRLTIDAVTVNGASAVSPQAIQDLAQAQLDQNGHPFLSRDNIFLFDTKALGQEILAQYPRIASAQVTRPSLFSQELDIAVVEREPEALWCATNDDGATGDCYLMDNTGFIYALAPADAIASSTATTSAAPTSSSPATPYIFEGGISTSTDATTSTSSLQASSLEASPIGQSFESAHMPGILVLLQLLGQAGFTPQGADVQDAQDFYIPLSQGFYLKASFGEDADTLVQNLQLVLSSDALQGQEQNLEYVDLRFGDKVYYKLNGQDETSATSTAND